MFLIVSVPEDILESLDLEKLLFKISMFFIKAVFVASTFYLEVALQFCSLVSLSYLFNIFIFIRRCELKNVDVTLFIDVVFKSYFRHFDVLCCAKRNCRICKLLQCPDTAVLLCTAQWYRCINLFYTCVSFPPSLVKWICCFCNLPFCQVSMFTVKPLAFRIRIF